MDKPSEWPVVRWYRVAAAGSDEDDEFIVDQKGTTTPYRMQLADAIGENVARLTWLGGQDACRDTHTGETYRYEKLYPEDVLREAALSAHTLPRRE